MSENSVNLRPASTIESTTERVRFEGQQHELGLHDSNGNGLFDSDEIAESRVSEQALRHAASPDGVVTPSTLDALLRPNSAVRPDNAEALRELAHDIDIVGRGLTEVGNRFESLRARDARSTAQRNLRDADSSNLIQRLGNMIDDQVVEAGEWRALQNIVRDLNRYGALARRVDDRRGQMTQEQARDFADALRDYRTRTDPIVSGIEGYGPLGSGETRELERLPETIRNLREMAERYLAPSG